MAFPPARWLSAYRREWLAGDAVAGVTLAAYAIPVSLAYASLAGLPPRHGLFCYLLGGLSYALPKRSAKGEHDDQAALEGRRFVPEKY